MRRQFAGKDRVRTLSSPVMTVARRGRAPRTQCNTSSQGDCVVSLHRVTRQEVTCTVCNEQSLRTTGTESSPLCSGRVHTAITTPAEGGTGLDTPQSRPPITVGMVHQHCPVLQSESYTTTGAQYEGCRVLYDAGLIFNSFPLFSCEPLCTSQGAYPYTGCRGKHTLGSTIIMRRCDC